VGGTNCCQHKVMNVSHEDSSRDLTISSVGRGKIIFFFAVLFLFYSHIHPMCHSACFNHLFCLRPQDVLYSKYGYLNSAPSSLHLHQHLHQLPPSVILHFLVVRKCGLDSNAWLLSLCRKCATPCVDRVCP